MRSRAQQLCPELNTAPSTISSAAQLRSTSGLTYAGSFPPSSSPIRQSILPEAACCTARPPATEPVKQTSWTSGLWITRVIWAKSPEWKYWITSCGKPASVKMEWICSTMVGVCGEGFRIRVLPASKAGMRELTRIK